MTKEEKKAKNKAWRESHKEYYKAYNKAWRESHREKIKNYNRDYIKSHKDENTARCKVWRESHQEEFRAYHRNYRKAYSKNDVNSSGQTKESIRAKSNQFLTKNGTKIPGYEIHHCFTYDEPYKFIYCSKETHQLIHKYLREHNIDADSNHYEQIKHLLDDTVILYGITK